DIMLTSPQPFANHNCGWIGFSPKDNFLYIGIGDGGSEGDPNNTSQNPTLLLGKMLRIDVNRDDAPAVSAKKYAIPADNPFATAAGTRPEIWAIGLRNPWRWSFDRATGDLYIGNLRPDAGQVINFQAAAS